ncbi:hypothetical protein SAMN06295905_0453 [Devosia lucknowensis]|uniref:Uncharacterized protein n=1 Tax=Devosia lucknowensis TaxID=1096929 RepID=A0A1Y6EEE0_9HYPH|nr:hypothetical protein [Devosia lucknowensis]SMQ60968.1 hypothetical protein SAMN06295905_0453 [Devosia lucknowensis]
MFLLRSAFWLTLAFLVIRPGIGADVSDSAGELSREAMARGSQFVAQQIQSIECQDITCLGGKALATAALQTNPHAGAPMHVEPAQFQVPLPRPRPDRAG